MVTFNTFIFLFIVISTIAYNFIVHVHEIAFPVGEHSPEKWPQYGVFNGTYFIKRVPLSPVPYHTIEQVRAKARELAGKYGYDAPVRSDKDTNCIGFSKVLWEALKGGTGGPSFPSWLYKPQTDEKDWLPQSVKEKLFGEATAVDDPMEKATDEDFCITIYRCICIFIYTS